MAKAKSQVDNIVQSYTEIESKLIAQVTATSKPLVTNEISKLVADSLDGILQSSYVKRRIGVCSFVSKDFEQILFDLFRRGVMEDILDNHITRFFDTSNATDEIGEKLLSITAFMARISTFIQLRISKAVTAERVSTKMANS